MAGVIRDSESKIQPGENKAPKAKTQPTQKSAPSLANTFSEEPLDPKIARKVAASIKKHQEALEYLKNN